jgi:hypothetical protein
MTHAYARGGGEMPAPRGSDEPRRGAAVAANRTPRNGGAGKPETSRFGPRPTRRDTSPWCPDSAGPYRLPAGIKDRLSAALEGRKNRDAAFTLAVFLARFWSSPRRLLCALPVDRRALAEHEALGLSEARVRGALAVLVEVGFLARYEPEAGKKYQRTEGGLQRRAILHRFGEEYAVAFTAANARAQAARGAPAPSRRSVPSRPQPQQVPAPNAVAPRAMSTPQVAQKQSLGGSRVIMGERDQRNPTAVCEGLEAALERLRRGVCP